MIFYLAFRNVLRNRRRSLLSFLMIAGSCAAIINFEGIAENTIQTLEESAINTQYGHLEIASEKFWNRKAGDKPDDRLILIDPAYLKRISSTSGVLYASPRISFYGLISTGEHSISAHGIGYNPAVESRLRENMHIIEGRNFTKDAKFQVVMGSGLHHQLGTSIGSSITLLAYTVDGTVNAIDSELVGVFQTGLAEIDDNSFFVSLETANKLLDSDKADMLVIQLNSTESTDRIRDQLASSLPTSMQIKTWFELALNYRKLRSLCGVINRVTETILVLLAILAVGNTIGMSITERTGEIGILRAQGDSRFDVVRLFLSEALILGLISALCGTLLGIIAGKILTSLAIPLEMPSNSTPQYIGVIIRARFIIFAAAITLAIAVLATLLPAIRASRMRIVDALKRNH
jgi:putative ABC transport system permease protein